MRLTHFEQEVIRSKVRQISGRRAIIRVFGSRVDDNAKGGDVDLMVEFAESVEHPAWLSATLSATISRAMHGRKVDVVIKADNVPCQPIHEVAMQQGIVL